MFEIDHRALRSLSQDRVEAIEVGHPSGVEAVLGLTGELGWHHVGIEDLGDETLRLTAYRLDVITGKRSGLRYLVGPKRVAVDAQVAGEELAAVNLAECLHAPGTESHGFLTFEHGAGKAVPPVPEPMMPNAERTVQPDARPSSLLRRRLQGAVSRLLGHAPQEGRHDAAG